MTQRSSQHATAVSFPGELANVALANAKLLGEMTVEFNKKLVDAVRAKGEDIKLAACIAICLGTIMPEYFLDRHQTIEEAEEDVRHRKASQNAKLKVVHDRNREMYRGAIIDASQRYSPEDVEKAAVAIYSKRMMREFENGEEIQPFDSPATWESVRDEFRYWASVALLAVAK